MEDATARRIIWGVVAALVVSLIGAVAAVELWSHFYWHHAIGIFTRFVLLAVVVALFVAVDMQARQRPVRGPTPATND